MLQSVLTIVLAGGKGTRLEPLTRDRAKPAVPFGGQYRIIDFVLSNAINSGLRKIEVVTQYKAASLDRHLSVGWRFLCRDLDEYIDVVPPQQRIGEFWYRGTADAIYQNIYTFEKAKSDHVVILGGDHIYKMNYRPMLEAHIANNADLTIGSLRVPLAEGKRFGVMRTEPNGRITDFEEKPRQPKPSPDDPNACIASMGIYVFKARLLFERLCNDAHDANSSHDFGKNIIPALIRDGRVFSFGFQDENRKAAAYWRDVGTLDEYYAANMDLAKVDPVLNLYDPHWPIRTSHFQDPPAKFVFGESGAGPQVRRGEAIDSIVCAGSIVSGGHVERSILARKVRVNSYALVEDSIIFDRVEIGRRAKIRRAIIDKDVVVPEGAEIGYDPEYDRDRGFTVTDDGVVVVAQGERVESFVRPQRSVKAAT